MLKIRIFTYKIFFTARKKLYMLPQIYLSNKKKFTDGGKNGLRIILTIN